MAMDQKSYKISWGKKYISVVRIYYLVHPDPLLQLDAGRSLTQCYLIISYMKTVSVIEQNSFQSVVALRSQKHLASHKEVSQQTQARGSSFTDD